MKKKFHDDFVNICREQSLLLTITKKKFNTLADTHRKKLGILDEGKFYTNLEECAERYVGKRYNTVPPPILNLLIKEFKLKVDTISNPFIVNDNFDHYCSEFIEDNHFLAKPDTLNHSWEENSFAYPNSHNLPLVHKVLNAAINSKCKHTIILIPKLHRTALHHPKLKLICWWKANYFTPHISNTDIHADEDKDSFKQKLNNISSNCFNCCPFYHQPKDPTNTPTFTSTTQLYQHDLVFSKKKRTSNNQQHLTVLWYYLFKLHTPEKIKHKIYNEYETPISNTKIPNHVITDRMVFQIKKLIPPKMMISIKDKNVGQLRVECQMHAQRRITKEISDSRSFQKVEENVQVILQNLQNECKLTNRKHLGYWHHGSLPEDLHCRNRKILSTKLDS